ncbi:unnamed protein product [Porites lobata]|uniref:Uncharacterized protein n=1 Tax=Porites lobata TaxID=104759 RepID=A0ABN8PIB5_9CNID|nr:unnamed protein product [Porites lobata]
MPRQKESYNLYPPLTVANVHLEKSFCVKYLATLISVYYSLIYPYLTYACTLWGNNYNAPLS